MENDDLYDETSITGTGIPKWVLDSMGDDIAEALDVPDIDVAPGGEPIKIGEAVPPQPVRIPTPPPREPEEYMKFTYKYCDADKYAPVQCMRQGPLRDCGHYICENHYAVGEIGLGYSDSIGRWEHCTACLGILNSTSYKLARWGRLVMKKKRFRKSIAQIKIARWWRRKLFIKMVNSQPNLTQKREKILAEQRQQDELIQQEKKEQDKQAEMRRGRMAWIEKLQAQNREATAKKKAEENARAEEKAVEDSINISSNAGKNSKKKVKEI